MEPLKFLIIGSILVTASALNSGPILPTPVSIEASSNNDAMFNDTTTERHALDGNNENSTIPLIRVDEAVTKQGRAMNMTSDTHSYANSVNTNSSSHNKSDLKESGRNFIVSSDLSDISMDNDDMDLDFSEHSLEKENASTGSIFGETRVVNKPHLQASDKSFNPLLMPSFTNAKDVIEASCIDSGVIYKVGETLQKGCEETCKCASGGQFICEPRCSGPFFRSGRKIDDPLCSEKETDDPCCAILVCAAESTKCTLGNVTYSVGESFHEGCDRTCQCETGGNIVCKARCPIFEHRDDCLIVPNSNDTCCKIQLCDVLSQDNDENTAPKSRENKHDEDNMANFENILIKNKNNTMSVASNHSNVTDNKSEPIVEEPILSITQLYNGTYQVLMRNQEEPARLEMSDDSGLTWNNVALKSGLLTDVKDGHNYLIRSRETKKEFKLNLKKDDELASKNEKMSGCFHKGKHRSIDEEFHMECKEICVCSEDGKVECAPLQCPSNVGLDLIDPNCVKWLPDPPDFVPVYPMCCPPALKCVSNGTCDYKGHMINNWSEVPLSLSGCDQRCFCESGTIECQDVCAPLPALPPQNLRCSPPNRPAPDHPPGDTCCKEWRCVPPGNGIISPSSNLTDFNKDKLTDVYRHNDTDKNMLASPIFVTLPPDLHKALKETFGNPLADEKNKLNKPDGPYTSGKKDFIANNRFATSQPAKTDNNKRYEYPGPFADPNHQPQLQQNGLGLFPFTKKHKEKQTYPYDAESVSKDNFKKSSEQSDPKNNTKHHKLPSNHDEYPVNDPYLSGSPLHVPFNQNGVGPGFFNPATTKNQQDYLNVLHQGNGNPNAINPLLYQPGNGVYHNAIANGNQVPQGPETFHVFTDGSPIHIEHLLQHIQQADHNVGSYIPFVTQPHQTNIPNNRRPDKENITANNINSGVGSFPISPGFGSSASDGGELQVVVLEASSSTSIRLVLSLPPVMVGLQGRVKLRYTDSSNPSSSKAWHEQEFAPSNDILASQQMEIQLESLKPNTLYHIEATVVLPQLQTERKSRIHSIKTALYQEETTLPSVIPIEPNLTVGHINSSSVQITWRSFSPDELHFIDGIQLRYREIDGKVFSGTPLIHRVITSFQLDALKPNTSYEVGIYFIPFLGQQTELQSANMIRFNTTPHTDMFDWNVVVDVDNITPWSIMIKWSGVPRPAERFVHVYRAVWRAEVGRIDASSFSLPTRDSLFETNVTGLAPGTKYRIWLELYLTNGRIKTSNVRDIMTKPGKPIPQAEPSFEGKLLDASPSHHGDYYSSLVVVAILAALGAMCSLVLLLVLVRRHRTASAPICGPTPAARTTPALPPYDSPTYKLDLHQETMDL